MEAVLEKRKTRINYTSPFEPKKQTEEVLTYEILQRKKREQQWLIYAGIIEKPKLVLGFTPEERIEFDKAISIEDYAQKRGIRI
ncbi:MAG: hypothetical protein LBN27_05475 [Prevotellaceae bacterium]|jgi:hypothetical protein|nr:hypothetical protein [Prevotellaceae bacterium]